MLKKSRFAGVLTLAITLLLSAATMASACSEIFLDGKYPVSARTFDFMFGEGEALLTPRGYTRSTHYANPGETPLKWTSKYGSITFSADMPMHDGSIVMTGVDGINEAGLKVGTYYLPESVMPEGEGGTVMCVTSLIEYALDNFATIDEFIADLESDRYRVISLPTTAVELMLHMFVHDATGKSAMIEFIDGKLQVTRNPEVPVLTNTPYRQTLVDLTAFEEFGGDKVIPGGQEPMDRFVRGAYYAKHMPAPETREDAIATATAGILNLTIPPVFEHGCTYWHIITDMTTKTVYFQTLNNRKQSWVKLDSIDFSEGTPLKTLNFRRTDLSGDVSGAFTAK